MPSDNFVEVHDVSLDSDTDAIQTILNREFEPLTNDGNFGIESLRENSLNTEFFLVRIFLYSDWIWRFTLIYFSLGECYQDVKNRINEILSAK